MAGDIYEVGVVTPYSAAGTSLASKRNREAAIEPYGGTVDKSIGYLWLPLRREPK